MFPEYREREYKLSEIVADFITTYGIQFYWNALYPTRDHLIPWEKFVRYYALIPMIRGKQAHQQALATGAGVAMVMGGEEGSKPAFDMLKSWHRAGYPEEYRMAVTDGGHESVP